jgi:hypothetical protein
MNPYRFELLHLLRRKAVIAVVIVAVLAGAFNYLAIDAAATGETITGAGFAYVDGGAYHVELWAYDVAGDAVPGVRVALEGLATGGPNGSGPLVVDYEGTQTSDAQGRLAFVLPVPPRPSTGALSVFVNATDPELPLASLSGALSGQFELGVGNGSGGPSPSGAALPQSIDGPINLVAQNFYSDQGRELVLWAEPGGRPPTGDRVLTCEVLLNYSPNSTGPPTCADPLSIAEVGPLDAAETFLPEVSPPVVTLPPGEQAGVVTEIVNASGGVEYDSFSGLGCSFGGPGGCYYVPGPYYGGAGPAVEVGPGSPGPSLLGAFATGLGLFVPLMALLLAYWSYARPRLSGTLEPVLARPVTRRGLFLTRYAALTVALGAASIGEVVVLDAGLSAILREPLPAGFLAPLVGGILVSALGFAGVVLLLAHLFRSTGPVLGIGVALLIVFSLFWGEIVAIVALSGGLDLSSSAFGALSLRALLAAPPQYPTVVTGLLSGPSGYFDPGGLFPNEYAAFGITGPVVAVCGTLWVLLPFLGTYWRVVTRD